MLYIAPNFATIHIQPILRLKIAAVSASIFSICNNPYAIHFCPFEVALVINISKSLVHIRAGLKWLCAKYIYFYREKLYVLGWDIHHFFMGYMYKLWEFLNDCGVQSLPSLITVFQTFKWSVVFCSNYTIFPVHSCGTH